MTDNPARGQMWWSIVKRMRGFRRAMHANERADRYYELIMAVGHKFPGETRHETALRYIRERETAAGEPIVRKQYED